MKFYIDEAGRGPLAGPLWVGCVLGNTKIDFSCFKDSKKCKESLREQLYEKISTSKGLMFSSSNRSAKLIDEKGIILCLREGIIDCLFVIVQSLEKLKIEKNKSITYKIGVLQKKLTKRDEIYIDGNLDFGLRKILNCKIITIIKGDDLIPQISAASIIAKVERDRFMVSIAKKYPEYLFDKHKGYGTLLHRTLIEEYGVCEIHRKSYCHFYFDKLSGLSND